MAPPLDLAAVALPAQLTSDPAVAVARSRLLRAQAAARAARAEHDEAETAYLAALLAAHGGNVTATAKALGVTQPLLSRWINNWGLLGATRGKAGATVEATAARAKKKAKAK